MTIDELVRLAMDCGFLDGADINLNIGFTCCEADLVRLADSIADETRRKVAAEILSVLEQK